MTAAATEFTTVGIPRDRWGRPLVIPPGGGKKRVAYRRVTTFVGVLEDRCHQGIMARPDAPGGATALGRTRRGTVSRGAPSRTPGCGC